MNAQTSTTTNEPHPADCLQETGCEECYQAEIAKVRALDAIRYPWASPAKLQWLREEIHGTFAPLFSRKGTKAGQKGVILLRVLPPVLPHIPTMDVSTIHDFARAEIAASLPDGHPVAAYLSTPAPNRVLVLWGEGMLAAHELPEAEGGIGFKVLVADPNWLDAPTNAPN